MDVRDASVTNGVRIVSLGSLFYELLYAKFQCSSWSTHCAPGSTLSSPHLSCPAPSSRRAASLHRAHMMPLRMRHDVASPRSLAASSSRPAAAPRSQAARRHRQAFASERFAVVPKQEQALRVQP